MVACASCGADNRPGRKFCRQCGAHLALACAACGAANEPGERFCGECGSALTGVAGDGAPTTAVIAGGVGGADERAARDAERRLVTILFADLVASTAAAEGRDPEETREVLDRYFTATREVIERYGGTVEKFIGDAVMAVWGAPAAHEDDAERGVRAALELVAAVPALEVPPGRPPLSVRAAVLTGEAAVTLGAEGQGMVAGDMVNTAARLQQVAEPGSVLVGEATQRAAGAAITFEPVATRELEGKRLPVAAWRAVRVVGVRGGAPDAALEPPFVGRQRELSLLKEIFHATSAEGRLHAVSITGQAGIGKSRLAWELEKYLDGLVEGIYWQQGRSPAYGEGITFWALGEMVRRRTGIAEDDDEATTRTRLATSLTELVPDEEERRWCEPKLLTLLGVSDTPQPAEARELFAAWRLFFERLADRLTTVLVFEDLHWADSGLIDFIEHLLEWSRQRRILIITLARPELVERRPTWGAGRRNFTSLHLEPLPDEAIAELLTGLVPGLPRSARDAVVRRAEGVPLYAVETVRMLLADSALEQRGERYELVREIEQLAVPETLQALIAARLDALPEPERRLVQHASVLGQSFGRPALEAISELRAGELDAALEGLLRAELLRRESDSRSPERGQYQFVQGVVREVAYGTLPRRERKERHLAAARYFESLADEEIASVLASHYLDAYRSAPAGDEARSLAAQARVALRAAAERADRLHAPAQALGLLEQALLVTNDETERVALMERAASSAGPAGRAARALELWQEAIDWHRRAGHYSDVARLTARMAALLSYQARLDESIALLEQANSEVARTADEQSRAALAAELARAYFLRNDDQRALPLVETAIDQAERHDLLDVLVDALITKGSLLGRARLREGRALLAGAVQLADTYGLTMAAMRGRNNLASELTADEPLTARRLSEEALRLAERMGIRPAVMAFTTAVAWSLVNAGEWDDALALLGRFDDDEVERLQAIDMLWLRWMIAAARGEWAEVERLKEMRQPMLTARSNPEFRAADQLQLGWEAMTRGAWEAAYQAARAAAAGPGLRWHALTLVATAACQLHDAARARRALDEFESVPTRGRAVEARRVEIRAGILAVEGRHEEAFSAYRDARRRWQELEGWFDLALTNFECATLLGVELPEGRTVAAEARAFFERVRANALIALLERSVGLPPDDTAEHRGGRDGASSVAQAVQTEST